MNNISRSFRCLPIISIFLPVGLIAQIGWYHPSTTVDNLNTVCFVDTLNGWAGGTSATTGMGFVRETTDGGVTWNNQTIPVIGAIERIVFLTKGTGLAVGQTGIILKTTDGGVNWIQKPSGTQVWLNSTFFVDTQHGWACGMDTVLSTTDQGETWSISTVPIITSLPVTALWDIAFRTPQVGWAVGHYGGYYKSTNGGVSWNSVNPPVSGKLFAICFPSASRAVAIGYPQIVLSTDAGNSWSTVYNSGQSQLFSLSFSDSLNGWAAGADKIVRTTDGGYSWQAQPWPLPYGYLSAVNSVDKNHAWVVGGQVILKTTNGGFAPYLTTSTTSLNFGWVYEQHSKRDSIWIANSGSLDLVVSSITSTNERFTVSPTSVNLAPSAGTYMVVTFAPLDLSLQSGYIVITHNVAGSPDSILLQGEGLSTGISHKEASAQNYFSLGQNYPNPFNPITSIVYNIPISSYTTLVVYDMLGREVETLVNAKKAAGHYQVTFNGLDLPSGIYFCRLTAGSFVTTKKLILIK